MKRKFRMYSFALGILIFAVLFALPVSAQQIEPAFGTNDYTAEQVFSFAFQGEEPYWDDITDDGSGYRYMVDSSSSLVFVAPVNLPSGITIDFIGLNYCDSNTNIGEDWTLTLYDMHGDHLYTEVGSITLPDRDPLSSCGYAYNSAPLNYQYDTNYQHHLALYANQVDTIWDGSMRFRGAEILYKRRISPAPGTATFSDVPVSHPFFQHIEALAASGITTGYGDGTYRPNNNVTRASMAAFLARALGLHWDQ